MPGSSPGVTTSAYAVHLALAMLAQEPVGELRHRVEQQRRGLAMRRVPHAGQEGDLDRAIAFLARDLDVPDGAVLVGLALHDQDWHPDIGERLGDVPVAERG